MIRPRRLAILAVTIGVGACRRDEATGSIVRRPAEIEFTATVQSGAFDDDETMPGYHAIAWRGGRMAHAALLRSDASDRAVLHALEALGARPGNNLPMSVWNLRDDPRSAAPDATAEGPTVEVLLRLPGRPALVPLATVLEDRGGLGFSFRFVGNGANSSEWKSGCIVCLYSCPGGKVDNARYTVRDYEVGTARFRARPGILPPDGTPVGVVLRLARSSSAA